MKNRKRSETGTKAGQKPYSAKVRERQPGLPDLFYRYPRLTEYCVILVLCLAVYGNSIGNGYNLDDAYVVSLDAANTQTQQGIRGIPEILTSKYSEGPGVTYGYRPLSKITLAIEYSLWGNNPQASHFINVLLFAINCMLLLGFIRQLAAQLGYTRQTVIYLSVFLFLVHPIHTEVVCSIKNREEILCFIFVLAACGSLFRYLSRHDLRAKITSLLSIAGFTILALLSKQTAFNLFGIAFLVLAFRRLALTTADPLPQATYNRKRILENIAVLLVIFILIWLLLSYVPGQIGQDNMITKFETDPYSFSPPDHRFPNFIQTIWFYLKKLLVPFPLLFYYGYDMLPSRDWSSPYPYAGLITGAVMLLFLAYLVFRSRKLFPAFWISFFVVTLLPFSNPGIFFFNVVGIVGERLVYQASAAYAVLLVLLLHFVAERSAKHGAFLPVKNKQFLFYGLVALFVLPYTYLTISRNAQWKDMLTLSTHDMRWLDRSVRANFMYGSQLMADYESRRLSDKNPGPQVALAKHHFSRALELHPRYDDALLALGTLYGGYYGMHDSAVYYLAQVDSLNLHNYIKARERLGDVYDYLGKPDLAVLCYRQALMKYPENYPLYQKLHDILMANARYDEAIALDKLVLPYKWPPVLLNLAEAFREKQDLASAARYYELALRNGIRSRRAADFLKAYQTVTTRK